MLGETLSQFLLTSTPLCQGRLTNTKFLKVGASARGAARILPCVLLGLCHLASAFSGWEHETLGQAGLLLASNYVSVTLGATNAAVSTKPPELTGERLSILRETVAVFYEGLPEAADRRKPVSHAITFGEIARLVDYMRDPYDMLHLPQSRVNLPVDAQTSNLLYLRSLIDHSSKVISLAIASHEAYNHFQGRALDAFCTYHKLAIAAACETNLWGALMLSAYSIHFLQDVFAPGHLLTPRDINAHNLDVAMLHDDLNNRGLMYVVEAPQQLMPLADRSRDLVQVSAKEWRSQDGKPKHRVALTNDEFKVFCERLATQPRLDVFCRGDDKVTSSRLEPVLLMVYCGRAISDVLESYVQGSPINSFPDYVWDRRSLGTMAGLDLVDMRLPYGEVTCSNRVATNVLMREAEKLGGSNDWVTNYSVVTSLTQPIYRNPGIAFTLGFESVSDFNLSRVRGLLEVEALVTGGRRDISRGVEEFKERPFPESLWPRSWGLTLGYSGTFGTDDHAHGVFGRVVWPISALNMQISAQVGGRYFWGEGVEGFRDFEMLRVDWGLHILTIFVAVGHDYFTVPDDRLHTGLAFQAGISIALPYSKIKTIDKLGE